MIYKKSTIGDECKVGDGAHASIPRQDSGLLYLSAKNFTKNGLSLEDVSYISESDFSKYFNPNSKALTKPRVGDLILGIIGAGLGVPYLIRSRDKEFGVSSSVAIIRAANEDLNPQYLYYWMIGPYFQKQLKNIQSGSAQGFLSLEMIRSLHLLMPPLTIQTKIASILSAYDELIENNKQRIKLLEEMAEEIYEEWFVRFRFPGYESTRFLNEQGKEVPHVTPGALPEGWEKLEILNAFEITGGGTPSTIVSDFWDNGIINWFSPTDITGSESIFLNKSSQQITELGLRKSAAKIFPENSVMMTSRATIGAIGINLTKACTNQGFITCIPNECFSYIYIYEWIKSNKSLIENNSSGATFKEISRGVFKKMKIAKPNLTISKKHFNLIEPMFEEIRILSQKNRLLQQTRDLLLPRLISGKLSVSHLVEDELEPLAMAAEPEAIYGK